MPSTSSPVASSRPGLWLSACLAAVLAACGGGGGGGSPAPEPPAANPSALATARNGELLAYVRKTLLSRAPTGSATGVPGGEVLFSAGSPTVAVTPSATVSRTGSVVQEAGVDEDDLLKTDGNRLFTLAPLVPGTREDRGFATLGIYTRDGAGRPQPAAEATLLADGADWVLTRGMLLAANGQRAAVIGEATSPFYTFAPCTGTAPCASTLLPFVPVAPKVHLQFVDTPTGTATLPRPQRWTIDGRLVGTRQIGRTLVMVITHAPALPYDALPASATEAERRAAADAVRIADVLPRISVDGAAAQPLVAETECWLQTSNASTQVQLTTITTVDLDSPALTRSSRCFVGGTEALYLSPANLYLATTRWAPSVQNGRAIYPTEIRTDVHKFALSGGSVQYRASGSVAGSLGWDRERNPYRFSEHNGDLRVLSFTGSTGWFELADAGRLSPSPATLTVLRERSSDASLQPLATLPNAQRPATLGKPGEQVYGVRFAGDRGYVVTFRQTDPLYVLDLSNPADPRTAGELELPGFSDWLFPLDGGLLFGVGKDASTQGQVQGVKVALFDVRDAARPALIDSRSFGQRGSSSALDASAHGISLAMAGAVARMALPLQLVDAQGQAGEQLQRFEVDTAARTLVAKAPLAVQPGWVDLSTARSLVLGNQLHYLRSGKLQTYDW